MLTPWEVELSPIPDIIPDPPDPPFSGLPYDLGGLTTLLPEIGIESVEELAAVEPEDLMHRASNALATGFPPVASRLLAEAVDAARSTLGLRAMSGKHRDDFSLVGGQTLSRTLVPRYPGDIEIGLELGPDQSGELLIEGPGVTERRVVTGAERVHLSADAAAVAAGESFKISLTNQSTNKLPGALAWQLPIDERYQGIISFPTVWDQIETILESLAVRNPGLGTTIPSAVRAPENIRMWLDRAWTHMSTAGVCSIDELGRFRLDPMRVLNTGLYVAPLTPPTVISTLKHYEFLEVLSGSVLHYQPNDVLHESAVVMAGEWDIRGQTVVIGSEVQELVVIAGSIRHDAASRITWQQPELSPPKSYWPNPVAPAGNGSSAGQNGQDGGGGDLDPHPAKNGGGDAVMAAPFVTMYLLDARNNLPPIDLHGQNGGRGGDGATGENADGTFFGGCCRGVGFGGRGGKGGDAGRGGKGGRGGQGGRITILTTAASIGVLAAGPPAIDVKGGDGGPGGLAGFPGLGGVGGGAGSADCEPWCDDHPERRGADGIVGAIGPEGFTGDPGPIPLEDAIQILPITKQEWTEAFNAPHILDITPDRAEPGETIQVIGENFNPAKHRVYFDGVNVAAVSTATAATFTVPSSAEGGSHPVIVREPGATARRSNRVMLQIIPVVDAIAAGTRLIENQTFTLTGGAFRPGLQVLAEDRSPPHPPMIAPPTPTYTLPVLGVTRTSISIQVPGGFLGSLRGVRRLVVQNPDGGRSRQERVVRIGDTIVVACAAFRVVGSTPGSGTTRGDADISNLFLEGAAGSINAPWGQARIALQLVQPVQTIAVRDDLAFVWPGDDEPGDRTLYTNAPGIPEALNFFFVRDVSIGTAFASFGGGPLFCGDEGSTVLSPIDFQQVVAHEVGHALCLRHVCDGAGEGPGTFFNRECEEDDDKGFLMYPFWGPSDGMAIHPGQVDPARLGATNFETGKTTGLPAASLFQGNNTCPQCQTADNTN